MTPRHFGREVTLLQPAKKLVSGFYQWLHA